MKRKRGAIIFDFDGTIADSFPVALDIFYSLTHTDKLGRKDMTRLRGMTLLQVARELRIPMWSIPFLVLRGRAAMRQRMIEVALISGMGEAIRRLSKRYTLFILSSNSPGNIRELLRQNGLEQYFAAVYGNVSLLGKGRKLRSIIKQQQLDRSHTWLVGDEARDVEAAHHNHIRAVAVSWGYNSIGVLRRHRPDALVFTIDELVRCFRNNA